MKSVRIYEDFHSLPAAYGALFMQAGNQLGFFLSLPWFQTLGQTILGRNEALRVYGVESTSPKEAAWLALPMCHVTRANMFSARKLAGLANYYTSLFGPVVDQSTPHTCENLQLLVDVIAHERPHWDVIDLHPMDKDAPIFQHIVGAFRMAGMVVQPYFCFGNWYLAVNGRSFQDYFNALPSKLRNTVRRKSAQLEKSGALRIRLVRDADEVSEGIEAYEKVYRSSWKSPEPDASFIPSLIRLCAEKDWLRLGVAYIDGQPVAVQVWIVCNGVASIYKLAYDEEFARLSVGSVLTARLMQHVIDVDKVHEVDYLTGDEPYKSDWMSHRRERWGIVAFNLHTIRGTLAACWNLGGHALKKLLKPMRW